MTKLDGIYTARDLYEDVNDLYEGKTHQQYDVGYKNLDQIFHLVKPMFVVVTGIPNSGKSSFTTQMALQLAKAHGFKFMIYSPEHSLSMNLKRLIEKYCEKPFDNFFPNRLSYSEMVEALKFIQDHFYFIDKKEESPDIKWILDRGRICVEEFGIDSILLDPYNEINPARGNISETEHISIVISDIKRFNRETNTISFLVAHPNKQIRDKETGLYKVNNLYDVSGSSNFSNKADLGMIVNRNPQENHTEIHICKVRELDLMGKLSKCYFAWNDKTRCFDPLLNYIP